MIRPIVRIALPLALAATLSSGCIGSFRLTQTVYDFNRGVGDLVVQEILFLAMVIVPVYPVSMFVDAVVLNTIEAFTGSNPLAGRLPDEGESRLVQLDDGGELLITHHGDLLELVVSRPGEEDQVHRVERRRDAVRLLNEMGREVAQARATVDGGVEVVDQDGLVLVEHSAQEVVQAAHAYEQGGAEGLVQELRPAVQ